MVAFIATEYFSEGRTMPQRVANVSVTVYPEGKRKVIAAGETYNFSKDEIEKLSALNPNALRKPINEEIPEEANNDGTVKKNEGQKADNIDTTSKDSELTPAEKAAQTKAAKAKAAKEENESSDDAEQL